MIENSVKAIIVREGELLLLRNKSIFGIGEWYSLPGGRQQPEETFDSAIKREVAEETGISIRMGRLLFVREYIHKNHEFGSQGKPSHKIEFMFECIEVERPLTGSFRSELDAEQIGLVWVPLPQLKFLNVIPRKLRRFSLDTIPDFTEYWGDVLFEE